jgi:hypothetical protein
MISVKYFDLSGRRVIAGLEDGVATSIEQLIGIARSQYPELARENKFPTTEELESFDPLGYGNEKSGSLWKRTMKALVFCYGGAIASNPEIEFARWIMYSIPVWFKRSYMTENFICGTIPCLVCGFKMHHGERFEEDSNRAIDVTHFAMNLLRAAPVEIVSVLCSHRGPSVPGGSWLAEKVPEEQVLHALRLQQAIIANLGKEQPSRIVWKQQFPGRFASTNLFPSLFMKYLEGGLVSQMLLSLEKQYFQIDHFLNSSSINGIVCELKSLDEWSASAWEYSCTPQKIGDLWKVLRSLAYELALPELKRIMPFHSPDHQAWLMENYERFVRLNLQNIGGEVRRWDLEATTTETIAHYVNSQWFGMERRALYECIFYYLWGRECGIGSSFGFGLDRDHGEYQVEAWKLGYANSSTASHPFLPYARRTETKSADGKVKELSFRQFWR